MIFTTINRLKQAVQEVTNLDFEARRLVFFQNSGAIITAAGAEVEKLANKSSEVDALGHSLTDVDKAIISLNKSVGAFSNADVSQSIIKIIKVARQTGLAVNEVSEAFVTLARTGQKALQGDMPSAFLETTLSLVRLEKGALSSEKAVRGLAAVQAQFLGGRQGTIFKPLFEGAEITDGLGNKLSNVALQANLASESIRGVGAVLAATAAGSTATVGELLDATTRLGAAFSNIAGLDIAQSIGILGDAFTATGAQVGRLSTAFRQMTTLIVQNAKEIELVSGIPVLDVEGNIRGMEVILDLLGEIKTGAKTAKAIRLGKLLFDRRNVADGQALAASVDKLKETFLAFENPAERLKKVLEAYDETLKADTLLVNSMRASINKLNVSFIEIVNSEFFREGFVTVVNQMTEAVQKANELAQSVARVVEQGKSFFKIAGQALAIFLAFKGAKFFKGIID